MSKLSSENFLGAVPAPIDQWSSWLFNGAFAARRLLEQNGWSTRTAYQGIKLQPNDLPSRGQCGVSSLWFAQRLAKQIRMVDACGAIRVSYAEGVTGVDRADEEMVWVDVRRHDASPLVIDMTSDQWQALHGSPLHVGVYDNEPSGGVCDYRLERLYDPFDVPHPKLLGRLAILEGNLIHSDRPLLCRLATQLVTTFRGVGS